MAGFKKSQQTSIQRLTEIIEKATFSDDGIVDRCMQNWHAQYQHQAGQEKEDLINRLLQFPDKKGHAAFISSSENPNPMRSAIERIFLDNSEKIAKWMLSDDKTDLLLSFRPEDGLDEKIGIGIARIQDKQTGQEKFVERDCYDAKMVLTKTSLRRGYQLWDLDFGIAMKTIYPDVKAPSSVPTGRDLTPDILASLAFNTSKNLSEKRKWLRMAGTENPDILLKAEKEIPKPIPGNARRNQKIDYAERVCVLANEIMAKNQKGKSEYELN